MKSDENKITKQITRQSESHVTVPQSKVNHTAKIHTASEVAVCGKAEEGCIAEHNRIAERAYEIYIQSGNVQGRSEINWLQAENEGKHRKQ